MDGSIADALAAADVVVTCRGVGTPILTVAGVEAAMAGRPGRGLGVVDLALARDAESGVGLVPGVRLVDLAVIQRHVPNASADEVTHAEQLVAEASTACSPSSTDASSIRRSWPCATT